LSQGKKITLAVIVVLILAAVGSCLFTVSEREQVVVTQLGRPIWVISGARTEEEQKILREEIRQTNEESDLDVKVSFGAGLYYKIPFLWEATHFDNRLLAYESDPHPITTRDKRTLIVDNFARWRITNPLRFMRNVRTEAEAQARLDDIIYSVLRRELGQREYQEVIRTTNNIFDRELEFALSDAVSRIEVGREEINQKVTEECAPAARDFGVLVIDVRIRRAELPQENMDKVYSRMQAERKRIAMRYEEEGKAEQAKIMAETDKEVKIKLADAFRKARVIEGEGEADALRIYAQGFTEDDPTTGQERTVRGYQSDPEFYEFLRSLEALEKVADDDSTFILTTRNQLFRLLESLE